MYTLFHVRSPQVCSVFITVEKKTFWYNYTLYASPQSESPQCVHQGWKNYILVWLHFYASPHVRMSAIRIQVYIYLLHIYATLSNIMYNFTPYDWITTSPHAVKSVFFSMRSHIVPGIHVLCRSILRHMITIMVQPCFLMTLVFYLPLSVRFGTHNRQEGNSWAWLRGFKIRV